MFYIFKWLSNLWNLRKIFDKYLPKIKKLLETVDYQQQQMKSLRQDILDMKKEIAKLKGATPTPDEEKKPTIVVPEGLECVGEPEYSKYLDRDYYKPKEESRITKVNRYYDPQLGVEYLDFEINGDKVSSEDDTVVE